MQFKIDQIALFPIESERAIELLTAMGLKNWVRDHVVALGYVQPTTMEQNDLRRDEEVPIKNEANLAFNYDGFADRRELEVLQYTSGVHWMQGRDHSVSHLGMHCSEAELDEWKKFFAERNIPIAQEVNTWSHTNPEIAGKRWYHYCIFDTRDILGVDLKFIARRS